MMHRARTRVSERDTSSTTHRDIDAARVDESRQQTGRPLESVPRSYFESHLGHDFADVRVHTDGDAALLADQLNARAFTVGSDIYFGAGEYGVDAPESIGTLAHELVHVAQPGPRRSESRVSRRDDTAEVEARDATSALMAGESVAVTASPTAAVSRKEGGEEDESWLEKAAWWAGEHIPGIGFAVEGTHAVNEAAKSKDPIETALHVGEALLAPVTGAAELGGFELFGEAGILGEGGGIGGLLGGTGLVGEGGLLGTLGTAWGAGGAEGVAGTILPSLFGGAEGAAILPGAAGMEATAALGGAGLEGAAALGPAAAVIGAGLAGVGAGIGLDKGADWLGDKITGNEAADHSISGVLADAMTAQDQMFTGAMRGLGVYDESKPEYTQTLGWQLAEILPSWLQ